MSNEYIKPRNKVIRGYDKLSYIWQMIAIAEYSNKRMDAREERSKINYEKIILELYFHYQWDADEDEYIGKRFERLQRIVDKYFIK